MIGRRILGTVAGVGFCMAVISLVEKLGHLALGVPSDPSEASLAMMAVVVLGWVLGTAIGGFIGVGIARWSGAAWIVAGLVAVGVVLTQLAIPMPLWLATLAVVVVLLTAKLVVRASPEDQRVAL